MKLRWKKYIIAFVAVVFVFGASFFANPIDPLSQLDPMFFSDIWRAFMTDYSELYGHSHFGTEFVWSYNENRMVILPAFDPVLCAYHTSYFGFPLASIEGSSSPCGGMTHLSLALWSLLINLFINTLLIFALWHSARSIVSFLRR